MINNYDKLTIGKYKEIKTVLEEDTDELTKQAGLVAVLDDLDIDDVLNLPLSEYNAKVQNLAFLTEEPRARTAPITKYKIAGKEYEVMLNLKDMTTGQYIDYQTYIKDSDKYMVELLSVFIIPKGYKYNDGYDIVEVQKDIRDNISIVDALTLSAFFLLLSKALIKATVTCSVKKLKRMMRKEKDTKKKEMYQKAIAHLQASGAGFLL